MKNYIILSVFAFVMLITITSAATLWVIDPTSCPNLDATNFPGQDCTPEEICGDSSGIAQCFDTPTMTSASADTTTYSTNNIAGDDDGGYSVNCYATADAVAPFCDNSGSYTCERNETFYGSPVYRNTICLGTDSGGTFGDTAAGLCKTSGTDRFDCYGDTNCESTSTSACENSANNHYTTGTCNTDLSGGASGTCVCDTNKFACDSSIVDTDGCEISATSSCGSGTGTIQLDECFSSTAGNCTRSSDFLDCNNGDSDNNELTCNPGSPDDGCEINPFTTTNNSQSTYTSCSTFQCVNTGTLNGWLDCDSGAGDPDGGDGLDANGCEVQNNSACTVGGLSGTISMCSGGSGSCVVDDQDIATTGIEVLWSGINPMLWLRQLGSGLGFNITFSNSLSFTINSSGFFWDGSRGATLDESQTFTGTNSFENPIVATGIQSDSGDIDTGLDFNAKTDNSKMIFNFTTQIGFNGTNTWFQDFLGINSVWLFDDSIKIENATTSNLFCTGSTCGNVTDFLLGEADTTIGNCSSTGSCSSVAYMNFENSGNFNITGNATFPNRIYLDIIKNHWIERGANPIFNGISTKAIHIRNNEVHPEGTVGFLVSAVNNNNQNITMIASQVGLNESGGVLGNSWMIIPNNLTNNLTKLTNCFTVMNLLGIDPRISCDTFDSGSDLLVQDSIQMGGILFGMGIRMGGTSGGTANFIMDGNNFNIAGNMHIRKERIEQVGFNAGDNVTLLTADFSGGLTPFSLEDTIPGSGSWTDIVDINCFNSPCASAGKSSPNLETFMSSNFSTVDFDNLNLSFQLTTLQLDSGDIFNVTVNNNTGSGDIQVYAIDDGIDENQLVTLILPNSMENQTTITLTYSCDVNTPNEECFVDEVSVVGTALINTQTNITRFDSLILGGSGDGTVKIEYNDTSKKWEFTPGNISASINAVNSSNFWDNLDTPSNINHSELNNLDEDSHTQYLLADGTRSLTGDWNAGINWITTFGFNATNWGNVTSLFDTFLEIDTLVADASLSRLDESQTYTAQPQFSAGINITTGNNITMGDEQSICGNEACSQFIKFNATGIYIQA